MGSGEKARITGDARRVDRTKEDQNEASSGWGKMLSLGKGG